MVETKIKNIWSDKRPDRKKLVDQLVKSLNTSYNKSKYKFIIQSIFNDWNEKFEEYFDAKGLFKESIHKDYYKKKLEEDARYAVKEFINIPNA